MVASPTSPSTRRLSEVARHVIIPEGIVATGWPAVESKCREFGDEFDEWQRGAGRIILGKRGDGIYAATVGGVTILAGAGVMFAMKRRRSGAEA